jgi:hypothetical protein
MTVNMFKLCLLLFHVVFIFTVCFLLCRSHKNEQAAKAKCCSLHCTNPNGPSCECASKVNSSPTSPQTNTLAWVPVEKVLSKYGYIQFCALDATERPCILIPNNHIFILQFSAHGWRVRVTSVMGLRLRRCCELPDVAVVSSKVIITYV